jgi:hypothetical protein
MATVDQYVDALEEHGIVAVPDQQALTARLRLRLGKGNYVSFFSPIVGAIIFIRHDKIEQLLRKEG